MSVTSGWAGSVEAEAPALASPDRPGGRDRKTRRWLPPTIAAGLLLLFLVLVAVTTGSSAGGALDPRSAKPGGSRALAALLHARGVDVNRGTGARPGDTVLVPFPQALTSSTLSSLLTSGADVVIVDPGSVSKAQLVAGSSLRVTSRQPRCDLPAATAAGSARMGGTRYTSGNAATSCYDGSLLSLEPGSIAGSGRLTVVGSGDFLTNDRLAQDGNAALAIGLLDRHPSLTWYTARRVADGTSLTDLLPKAVPWALLQLVLGVLVIAVWRARRLGPVVTEPLPVVVRAAETVLGRARLYAAARARPAAVQALRAGSRARLAALVHLDAAASPQTLTAAVAARAGIPPAEVAGLLFDAAEYAVVPASEPAGTVRGAEAVDPAASDAGLTRLADRLDELERRVHTPATSPQSDVYQEVARP